LNRNGDDWLQESWRLKECLSTSLPTGQIMVKFALYDAGAREDNHRNADSAKNRAKTLVGGTEGGVGVGDGRGIPKNTRFGFMVLLV